MNLFSGRKLLSTGPPDEVSLEQMMRSIIPPLDPANHKGECGRIAVVGGSKE